LVRKLTERYEKLDKPDRRANVVWRFRLGIILTMIRKTKDFQELDINKNEMKVSNVGALAAREDAEFRKLEALRNGVEHL
jgi:hypothetical protein